MPHLNTAPTLRPLVNLPHNLIVVLLLFYLFDAGLVKGETVIELSVTSSFVHMLVAADYFDNIIMLHSCESDKQEAQKWLNKEPEAIDHSHLTTFVCGLKGEYTTCEEHEEKTRTANKQVVQWDITKENPLDDVVLPQADCVLSFAYLDLVSKDHEMYLKLLKQISSLVKIGGHLIMLGALNETYYMLGQHEFSTRAYDEQFVRKALAKKGFIIERFGKEKKRHNSGLCDYEYLTYSVSQRKERPKFLNLQR
ncbi:nicotinamide N-methyltransferase [Xenopus laevis]|uniref:Nicotinamide N-methyltransferase n=2 Tax=Xenopus laevis TaxID=8355 RepID=A0A8J1LJG5_XENLA|nr:nicotinamide N-methyltransferase [Xenopus laevis]